MVFWEHLFANSQCLLSAWLCCLKDKPQSPLGSRLSNIVEQLDYGKTLRFPRIFHLTEWQRLPCSIFKPLNSLLHSFPDLHSQNCESISKKNVKSVMHQISTSSVVTLCLNTDLNVRLKLLIINKTFQNLFVLRHCGILREDSTETLKQEVWKNFKGSENIPWYVIPIWPPFHYSRPCPPCCLATPSTIRHYTNPPIFPTSSAHLHLTEVL